MAQFDATDFSSRKLQGRRYTGLPFDSQEASTSTIDIQSSEILTDDRYIPTGSLPFSGSSQHLLIASRSLTDDTIVQDSADDGNVLQYHYRHKLTRAFSNDTNRETFYFLRDEPATAATKIGSDQLITGSQYTNFISNKNLGADVYATLGAGDAENALTNGLAYNVIVYKSTDSDKNNVTVGDVIDAGNYVFDYKTGILSFTSDDAVNPDSGEFIYMTAYRYVGRTLKDQLADGSLGGGSETEANLTALNIFTGSIQTEVDALNTFTGSIQTEVDALNTFTGSIQTEVDALNTFTGSIQTEVDILSISASVGIHFMTSSATAGTSLGLAQTASFGASGNGLTVDETSGTITYTITPDDVLNGITSTSTFNFTASVATTALSASTIEITDDNTTSQYFGVVFADNTGSGISLKSDSNSGYGLTYNPSTNALRIGAEANRSISITAGETSHNLTADQAADTINIFTTSNATVNVGTSATAFTLGNDSAISTTTLNGHTVNVGRAEGTVNILGSASIAGDLIVQGDTVTIRTTNLNVEDKFILLNSGSNTGDGGIVVQNTALNGTGQGLFWNDQTSRWVAAPNISAVGSINQDPRQYIVTVSASLEDPLSNPQDYGDTDEYYGMMHVNTSNGEIWIYS